MENLHVVLIFLFLFRCIPFISRKSLLVMASFSKLGLLSGGMEDLAPKLLCPRDVYTLAIFTGNSLSWSTTATVASCWLIDKVSSSNLRQDLPHVHSVLG